MTSSMPPGAGAPVRYEFADVGERWEAAMRGGDFEEAWRQTDRIEHVRRARAAAGAFTWTPEYLHWSGAAFDDRHVLVRCNHGLGDTLQFIRFVPLLRERARRVTVMAQPELVPLLSNAGVFGLIRNGWTEEPPPFDVEIEVMELAYAFRCTPATLPAHVPYLPPDRFRARAAASIAPRAEALRVGLLWASSDWDTSRSIPIEMLAPLAAVQGARYFALQQGRRADDWRRAAFPIEPLSSATREITALAAAMLDLDLIVTVDAMVAHLAGALARPVWVLLQEHPDWRWMERRPDSPWYPTMRLFRQPRTGDWRSVAESVASSLHACAAARLSEARRYR
jgi:hypothetical protein